MGQIWLGSLTSCNTTGSVNGRDSVGGLVGYSEYGTLTSCDANGSVTATGSNIGGLVGYSGGRITSSYAYCEVRGIHHVGGLVGSSNWDDVISCYATGSVSGTDYIGGLVGSSDHGNAVVQSSYSTGSVSGRDYVGGLAGYYASPWPLASCYSTGSVNGRDYVGGLVGRSYRISEDLTWVCDEFGCRPEPVIYYVESTSIVENCFWDTETSGRNLSAGGTGKATAEMQTLSTFTDAGWDFSVPDGEWRMTADGMHYPRLAWESLRESYVVLPREVGNGGVVTAYIVMMTGSEAFAEGVTARLTGDGIPDISMQSVRILSDRIMEVDFDLTESPVGNRSVVVDRASPYSANSL